MRDTHIPGLAGHRWSCGQASRRPGTTEDVAGPTPTPLGNVMPTSKGQGRGYAAVHSLVCVLCPQVCSL
jgi:hypothetical protein